MPCCNRVESRIHLNLDVDEQPPVLGARSVVAGSGWQEQGSVARSLPHMSLQGQRLVRCADEFEQVAKTLCPRDGSRLRCYYQ